STLLRCTAQGPRRASISARCSSRRPLTWKACSLAFAASSVRGGRTAATRRSVRILKREEVASNGKDLTLSSVQQLPGSRLRRRHGPHRRGREHRRPQEG